MRQLVPNPSADHSKNPAPKSPPAIEATSSRTDFLQKFLLCGHLGDVNDAAEREELEGELEGDSNNVMVTRSLDRLDEDIGANGHITLQSSFQEDLTLEDYHRHRELRSPELESQRFGTPERTRSFTQAERRPPRPPPSPHHAGVSGGRSTTELHRIAKNGDWKMLRSMLTRASDHSTTLSLVGRVDEKGRTPLMLACQHGSGFPADVARLLVVANNQCASTYVAQRNDGELTCLHVAATTGCSVEILDILYGAYPPAASMEDSNGNMPLHLAVNNGKYRCLAKELQLENSNKSEEPAVVLENTPDHLASKQEESNNGDCVSTASSCESSFAGGNAGFDDDTLLSNACETLISAYPPALQHRNRKGETPLLLSMYRRTPLNVLTLLLTKGGSASAQIPDDFGSLPLHFCDRSPSIKIVRDMARLYPQGVTGMNKLKETPLYSAMLDTCDAAVLRVMLEVCSELAEAVNIENNRGASVIQFGWDSLMTPKIVAAEDEDEERARLDENEKILLTATDPNSILGTAVGLWWEKTTLLLQAAYHNTIKFDEKTGSDGTRAWSPAHAVAGTICPPEMVKFVLQLYAHDITRADESGNTPYHVAALHYDIIGLETMRVVAHACSQSALIKNKDGNTPLHLVCLFDAPLDILEVVVESCPEAVRVTNNAGQTPLFVAISVGSSIAVIRMLLKACPESVHVRDANGMSTIALAWNMLLSGVVVEENGESSSQAMLRSKSNINTLAVCARSSSLGGDARVWMGKIDLLLRTAFHGTAENRLPRGRRWRAVHAACAGGICNPDVLSFSLQILPFEVRIKNEDHNLPLHIAASAPPYEEFRRPEFGSGESLNVLLNLFPDATKVTDRKGRLPLHLALASCKTWNNGVEALVDAFPEAVRMRDPVSMLFPFMLAASAGMKENYSQRSSDSPDDGMKASSTVDLVSIGTIFMLLRKAPELVNTLQGNAEMVYLRRKNNELCTEIESLKKEEIATKAELRARMSREELREIEDYEKISEIREKEEECRSRAEYLEMSANDIKGTMSGLSTSIHMLKESSLSDRR